MKNLSLTIIVLLILSHCANIKAQSVPIKLRIDTTIVERMIQHCKRLSEIGPRPIDSPNHQRVIDFIVNEFKSMDIDVKKEPFQIESFELDSAVLIIGNKKYTTTFLALNPYNDTLFYSGKATFIKANTKPTGEILNQFIITDSPDMHFSLMGYLPKLIICIKPEEFEQLDSLEIPTFTLTIKGNFKKIASQNLVVNLGKKNKTVKEVILSAHYDSYRTSPGANDNGTGIAGILEIGRYLKSIEKELPFTVKLVLFDAEEHGLVGSQAYIAEHINDLDNCILDINFDTFGGNDGPVIGCNPGQSGIPIEDVKNQYPAQLHNKTLEGLDGSWRIQHSSALSLIMAVNYPEWLAKMISDCSQELDIPIKHRHLMSDHESFAYAGVPAISIQSRDHTIHVPEDVLKNLNRKTIEKNTLLALKLIEKIMNQN